MLDSYSLEAKNKLLKLFPDWAAYAREEVDESGGAYLAIVVPAPAEADTAYGLCITTQNEEITVGFDHYHAHFGLVCPQPDQVEPDAVTFIEQIVGEHVAVVSWWQGDTWLGSSQLMPHETLNQPSWLGDRGEAQPRVRSWKGAHNHWSRT